MLLGPLCDATDALARLDGRAGASEDRIRDGLIARLALAEAAGWLAHAHVWVHPLDLALRAAGLTRQHRGRRRRGSDNSVIADLHDMQSTSPPPRN